MHGPQEILRSGSRKMSDRKTPFRTDNPKRHRLRISSLCTFDVYTLRNFVCDSWFSKFQMPRTRFYLWKLNQRKRADGVHALSGPCQSSLLAFAVEIANTRKFSKGQRFHKSAAFWPTFQKTWSLTIAELFLSFAFNRFVRPRKLRVNFLGLCVRFRTSF